MVDCDLVVKRQLIFEGGNIVMDGDVTLSSSGDLQINGANTSTYNWVPGAAVDHREHSGDAAYVYMRNGIFSKSGQASITLTNTMMYLSPTSGLSFLGGGSGSLLWAAPEEGPFEDLAMWSEGTSDHDFAGQSSLQLSGVFFAPVARITYAGNGAQQHVAAQFVSEKLAVSGNGLLVIEPTFDRAVTFPDPVRSELIR